MSKNFKENKFEKFFQLVKEKPDEVVLFLINNPKYRKIRNEYNENVFYQLILASREDVVKTIIDKNLSDYSLFIESLNLILIKNYCQTDKYKKALDLIREEDREGFVLEKLENIIYFNNYKMLQELNIDNAFKMFMENETIKNSMQERQDNLFRALSRCDEKMLNLAMPIYKELLPEKETMCKQFNELKNNKERTIALLENFKGVIDHELREQITNVNEHAGNFLKNKELKDKLENNLDTNVRINGANKKI